MSQDAAWLQTVLRSLMKPIIVANRDGLIQYINPATERLAGYELEEVNQKPVSEIFKFTNENTGKPVDDGVQRTIHEGRTEDLDLLLQGRHDRKIPVEREGVVLRSEDQAFSGVLLMLQDVTQRRKMDEALRRSKEWFRSLVEEASAIPWRMDADTLRFIYVGPRVNDILGYPSEKWMDEGFWQEHIHPEDRPTVLKKLMLFRSATGDQEYEYRMLDAHGQVVWIRNIVSAPRQQDSGTRIFHGFMFNITQAKQLEDKLRQIQRLEMAEKLAMGVANDFNNMLGVIENSCESLWFVYDSDITGRNYLHQIKTAILRAKTLTRQLQAFSSSYALRPIPINLNKLMTDLEPLLKMKAPQGIAIQWLKNSTEIWIEGDSNQIGQLFINLFLYAVDSVADKKGRIHFQLSKIDLDEDTAKRLSIDARGAFAMLTVEDNGRTIDPASASHLFDPYYSKEGSSHKQGLELAAIYGIVRKHQGFIQYEPVLGGGTRFDIFLPLLTDKTQQAKAEEAVAPRPETWFPLEKQMVVLLVDNEELVRQGLRRILERNGFSVLEANCGENALEVTEKYGKKIDLLISDMVMPGMSALNLCKEMTQRQPEITLLIISGLAGTDLNNEELPKDIPFLQKPFSSEELMSYISEIMPRKKQEPTKA